MRIFFLFIAVTIFLFSCKQKENSSKSLKTAWLDSIIKNSDSSYTKPYYRSDFVTAEYYINKKDSSTCQLMKDSAGHIKQIMIVKKEVRTFFGQYYNNGQLQAELPLDGFGHFHGPSTYYFKDGTIESSGNYVNGVRSGEWRSFDPKGKMLAVEEYDSNGNLLKTTKN